VSVAFDPAFTAGRKYMGAPDLDAGEALGESPYKPSRETEHLPMVVVALNLGLEQMTNPDDWEERFLAI
jgi:hypothetical protein